MAPFDPPGPTELTLPEAAGVLQLPVASVRALMEAAYLHPSAEDVDGPRFALGDLKAFLARNADGGAGAGDELDVDLASLELAELAQARPGDDLDPQVLLDALGRRADDMARRALDLLLAVFPEATRWSERARTRFVDEARDRFEAIVAVAALGHDLDEELVEELGTVGAQAARDGTPLPEVQLVLRISRDLVVQTAVEVAGERGPQWGLALALVLTRILPALDALSDAIARGWWQAVLEREQEDRARYARVVEASSDGVYEVGQDGRITYANAALATLLGRPASELVGARLSDVLGEVVAGPGRRQVAVVGSDGENRVLDIRTLERKARGEVVGLDGIVRDRTGEARLS